MSRPAKPRDPQNPVANDSNAEPSRNQAAFSETQLPFRAPKVPPLLRLLLPAAVGLSLWPLWPGHWPWELRASLCWNIFALGYLLSSWWIVLKVDGDWIRQLAQREDNGRRASSAIALTASLISLGGVMFALSRANTLGKTDHALATSLTLCALLSVALSWLLIQTVYLFRYAHLYYEEPEGGVQFVSTPEPDYLDFAYLSFTIGMTYQVSDTNLDQKPMRRLLTSHALISYVYGVVIIALAISVVGSLFA